MDWSVAVPQRMRWGLWPLVSAVAATLVVLFALQLPSAGSGLAYQPGAIPKAGRTSPELGRLAARHPARKVEVLLQFQRGVEPAAAREAVRAAGGHLTGDLHIINALAARMSAGAAKRLAGEEGVRAVSLNAAVEKNTTSSIDSSLLATSYPFSVQAPKAWSVPATGNGVGVAVIDTGIASGLADFRRSQGDSTSRVIANAVTNPYAKSAGDSYGHGTHVAGILAGNGNNRDATDPLRGRYLGIAPKANLINVKVSDEQGAATVLDVIYGLQFAVDFKDSYNIRVVNLSLESTQRQSYKTDPLDAAAEAAWFHGIVVVAAAGNRGTSSDAVSYAPGNDPYVISVGGVDDRGTKNTLDDVLASWSSRGITQDGYAKPDILAPGAHIVSNLAPYSTFTSLCPSCIVDGQYIRAGGTSMAAPMVSGAVADLLQVHPGLTPDQVKGSLVASARKVSGGQVSEVSVQGLTAPNAALVTANEGLTPSTLIDPSTGEIAYSRSTWSRSTWSGASWNRSTWSCNCSKTSSGTIDPSRSAWSRSTWSTSWSK